MFPEQFIAYEFYQKKKDILLYRARDHARKYILKSIITKDEAVKQAFYDEYESLSCLISDSLPIYCGITEDFHYPDRDGDYLTLCMEDCSEGKPLDELSCSLPELTQILTSIGKILVYLLEHGILYTDLNPSNILVMPNEDKVKVILLDFTFCYYFGRNPYPAYPLRFSYNLNPALKGQQLLIQELALLLQEMILKEEDSSLPSSLLLVLETGLHPSESLTLPDYIEQLRSIYHPDNDDLSSFSG